MISETSWAILGLRCGRLLLQSCLHSSSGVCVFVYLKNLAILLVYELVYDIESSHNCNFHVVTVSFRFDPLLVGLNRSFAVL